MASSSAQSPTVLGIYVGPDTLDAVALRVSDDAAHVVGRVIRQRGSASEMLSPEKLAMALPGLKGSSDSDYTLEVGDGSSSATTFTPSEFGIGGSGPTDAAPPPSSAFAVQLREILAEIQSSGQTVDRLAFVIGHPDSGTVEIALGTDDAEGTSKLPSRKQLLALLKDRQSAPVVSERTAFLPMAPAGATARVLAVTSQAAEPVGATLRALAEAGTPAPAPASLDAETATLADLIATGSEAADDEVTAFVRVGTEDTLLLVAEGSRLAHVERLRSLTAYDLPDTVASRVLLQLDQKKISAVHSVYVSVAGRQGPLVDTFQSLFPDAAVEPAPHLLAGAGVALVDDDDDANEFKAGALTAAAAALLALAPDGAARSLLPGGGRTKKKIAVGTVVPTIVAALLLATVLSVAVFRYLRAESEISDIEADLAANPVVMPAENPDQLQARVDSLNRAFTTYTRALDVLDSLLLGSDQWTQAMRLTTRTVSVTGGTWFQSWAPDPPNVRVTGQSLSRPQIVELTRRLGGTIEMLEYTDVGNRRVYTFDMLMPIEQQIPEVSMFLREIAEAGTPVRDSLAQAAGTDADAYVLDPVGHDH